MENLRTNAVKEMNRPAVESIDQALKLLDNAARSHSDEIKRKVVNDYKGLREVITKSEHDKNNQINDYISNLESQYQKLQGKTVDLAKMVSGRVDQSAHKNPWYYVGGAAIAGSVLGLFLSNKIKGGREIS